MKMLLYAGTLRMADVTHSLRREITPYEDGSVRSRPGVTEQTTPDFREISVVHYIKRVNQERV